MNAFIQHPRSVFLRRALVQVHLWVGVLAGLYVVIVCTSGAALVFRLDLQRALHPDLFTPSADGPLAHPADVLDTLRRAYPEARVAGIDAPTTARPTYLGYVVQDGRFETLLLDPATASLLGALPERSIVRTLQDLHFDLLAGRTGRLVNGAGAILLLVLCATGLVIWWPGRDYWRRGFAVDIRGPRRRLLRDLHGVIGISTVIFIAMSAATGLAFVFPSQFRSAVNAISPVTVTRPPHSDTSAAATTAAPSWREQIALAQQHVPDAHVARIVVPARDEDAFHVLFSPARPTPAGTPHLTSVYLDQFTGALLQEPPRGRRTAGDTIMAWVGPLHFGNFGGPAVQVLWLVPGLAPPLLFATGFLLWWRRVVRPLLSARRAPAAAPAAQPDSDGTFRNHVRPPDAEGEV